MKAKICTALLFSTVFLVAARAQRSIPQKVKAAFAMDHPGIQNAHWESENGNFEGNWKVSGTDHSALYSPDGKFLMSEADIAVNMLPDAAKRYMNQTAKKKIKEASKNVDADGTVTYEADVKGGAYVFDVDGKFIKTANGD